MYARLLEHLLYQLHVQWATTSRRPTFFFFCVLWHFISISDFIWRFNLEIDFDCTLKTAILFGTIVIKIDQRKLIMEQNRRTNIHYDKCNSAVISLYFSPSLFLPLHLSLSLVLKWAHFTAGIYRLKYNRKWMNDLNICISKIRWCCVSFVFAIQAHSMIY